MSTRDAASAPPPSPGGAQGDAFDMLKNMWNFAGMGTMPGMQSAAAAQMTKGMPAMLPNLLLPTFDVEELDKRITDLRAVEQWLQLNASMLRATIQALELQRTTLASMQKLGGAMLASTSAATSTKPAATPSTASSPTPSPAPAVDPTAWWNSLQQQFSQIAAATAAGAAAVAAAPAATPKPARKRPPRS